MKPCFQGKGLLGGGSNCSSGHRPVQPVTRPENRAATDQIQRVVVRLLGLTFRTQGQHGQRVGRSCQTLGGNGPNPTRGRAAAGSNVQNAAPARLANWTVLPDPGWQRTKSNAWSCGCWVGGSERSGSTGSELDGLVRPDGRSRRAFATRFPWSVRGRIHETKINQSCFRQGRY